VTSALGLETGVVRLVEYDAEWPALYRTESERIAVALAPLVLTLEHMGSTAVPGLAAKPICDILAGYHDRALFQAYIDGLCAAGYEHLGEQGIPGREFFRRGQPPAYHLHLAALDGIFWREHLAFRDLLRSDSLLRATYEELKQELAAEFPQDRDAYIDAKNSFIQGALARRIAKGEA
jgi:GrpB-like predicted nucleotidyltransferase (UPF0157 family)